MAEPLLKIQDLKTYFFIETGVVKAVDQLSMAVEKGDTFGVVGESGCGKSTVALSILRLVPVPGQIVGGNILFNNEDLLQKSESDMRKVRGRKISLIFQDPTDSLNPVFTIGSQISEVIRLHREMKNQSVKDEVVEVLKSVGIPSPETVLKHYPHEYSGGMRQRAMIAMALSCRPELLIADEPTTNLDVTIQAQILELLKNVKDQFKTTIMLITHNLGVIAEMCNRVAVMYAGKIVECSDVYTIFKDPLHPYTQALLQSIPRVDIERGKLSSIPGQVPDLVDVPEVCRFHDRCKYKMDVCEKRDPPLVKIGKDHMVSCFLHNSNGE